MHNKLASEHHIIVIESDWRPSWWNWLDCFCYSPVDTVNMAIMTSRVTHKISWTFWHLRPWSWTFLQLTSTVDHTL